jgi:hypothetical protein
MSTKSATEITLEEMARAAFESMQHERAFRGGWEDWKHVFIDGQRAALLRLSEMEAAAGGKRCSFALDQDRPKEVE